jgi:peptidoglycan/xylan/chitin deacetylase (PgdA/CDA1 family)
MKFPGLKTSRQVARWLCDQIRGGALILGYHRVAHARLNPYSMCVSPEHFAEQLAVLRAYSCPMSLLELVELIRERRLPRRAVVLTFDDGYADFIQAQVLLERHHMPATVFVSPAYIGREFWWDELSRILLSPATLPERLSLEIGDRLYQWAIDSPIHITWNRMPPTPRQRLLLELYGALLPLPLEQRRRAMSQLRAWAGADTSADPQCRALTEDELNQVATTRLVDVGLHSMTHPFLARLSVTAQQAEILQGKAYLEKLSGHDVTTFSYPNGSFSEETTALVQDAGFFCACASQSGLAWHEDHLFRLPRLWVPDWDGATFSRWLHRWLSS